jgi:hypothetical protein
MRVKERNWMTANGQKVVSRPSAISLLSAEGKKKYRDER